MTISAPHKMATQPDNSLGCADIAVIIPYYKGIDLLDELISRLQTSLSEITQNYEIFLVDDRSPDAGWIKIQEAAKKDSRVKGIRLSRNFGQHPAISAGVACANAHWYVVMDCDLQDRPEDISELYKHALNSSADIVLAEREVSGLGRGRNLGSKVFNSALSWISGLNVSSKVGNFRIFSQPVAEAYRSFPEQMRLFPAIMDQLGFVVENKLVSRSQRLTGPSSYSFAKLVQLAFDTTISYTEKPLRYFALFGLLVCGVTVTFGLWTLIRALAFGISVPGYASQMILITFIGGFQTFLISIVGVYVGRVFNEVKRRPIFIIDKVTGNSDL